MIGREKKAAELNDLYHSENAEFIAIYGRRRVGKTYLIDEVFRDRIAFRHTGLSPVDTKRQGILKKQLEHFYYSLLRHGMEKSHTPRSWLEAFFMLESFLEGKDDGARMVIFLDELPWMDTPRSGFITALEAFWNSWCCHRHNIMLIVCGSASSWLQDNLINNHGGLYNRITYQIKLNPFTLRECEQFFQSKGIRFSRYDIAQSYMIFGGIPYYLGYFRKDLSLSQNVDTIIFSQQAKLRNEYTRLFESVFDKPSYMRAIVEFLTTRAMGYTRKEITDSMGLSSGNRLTEALQALIACDFITQYVPFGQSKKSIHYKVSDPFCIFWLHFVKNYDGIEDNYWQSRQDSQQIISWRGLTFELVCFNHMEQIKKALGISGIRTSHSSLTIKGSTAEDFQIDLLIERGDNVLNICEIKFYHEEFRVDKAYYQVLLSRPEKIRRLVSAKQSVRNTLITTFGLKKNEYSGVFSNVITLDDLFS